MIQIRKFYDIIPDEGTPTSQTHKDMSAEEILDKHEWLKGGGWTKDGILKAMQEYASQPQPLPVGGKSVENCFDEIGNKINTLQDVNLKNRLHAAKDLLKLHLQSSLPVQQPVSDGVEFAEWILQEGYDSRQIFVSPRWSKSALSKEFTSAELYKQFKNKNMKTGMELIHQERQEQINKHGFSLELDKEHYQKKELKHAAEYCLMLADYKQYKGNNIFWPESWGKHFEHKIINKSISGKLIVAGALFMAENERRGDNLHKVLIEDIAAEIDRINNIQEP